MINPAPPLFQRPLDQPAKRLLVLGDSQAVGVGTSAPEHSISGLFSAAYPDWSVETVGVSGAKLPGVTQLVDKVAESRYDLILIFAGANDLIWFSSQSSIRKNLPKLISAVQPLGSRIAISHGGNLGMAPVWPRIIAPYFTHRSKVARATYQRLAEQMNFIYLDLFNHTDPNPDHHAEDGLHPNDAGYAGQFKLIQQLLSSAKIDL